MKKHTFLPLCEILLLSVLAQIMFAQKPEPVVQTGHSDTIFSIAFSPDGKYIASGGKDRSIKIRDAVTGVEVRTLFGHRDTVRKVVFSPDGKMLGSAGTGDGTVRLWNVESGEPLKILKRKTQWNFSGKDRSDKENEEHYESVTSVTFSPNGKIIASCNYKAIKLWDTKTGELLNTFINHDDWIYSIAFNSEGKQIISAGNDKTIKISDAITGQVLKTFEDNPVNQEEDSRINSTAFSPDEKTIISVDSEGKIKIWDVKSGRKSSELKVDKPLIKPIADDNPLSVKESEIIVEDSDTLITSVTFLSESLIATGGCGGTVTLWNLSNGQKRALTGHTKCVESIAFSPKNNILASGSKDKSIRFWNIQSGKETRIFRGKTSRVSSGAFAHRSPLLAVGFNDSIIKLWNLERGECKTLDARAESPPNQKYPIGEGIVEYNYGGLMKVAFSPDDKILATGNRDIKLWEPDTGRLLQTMPTGDVSVNAFAYSPKGDRLASNSLPTGIIRLWDTKTGKKLKDFIEHDEPVDIISFSPDGDILASASRDKTIKLWNVEKGVEIKTFREQTSGVRFLAFSGDGEKLLSEGEDGNLIIWNVKNQQKIASFSINDTDLRQKLLNIVPTLKIDNASIYGRKFSLKEDRTGSVHIFERSSNNLLVTLFRLDKEWAVSTPEGFFDSSLNAWKQLVWRFNNNTFDYGEVELYFNEFFYPNLLQEALAGRSPKPKAGRELEEIDRRQPKVKIISINGQRINETNPQNQLNEQSVNETVSGNQLTIDKRTVTVAIEVTENTNKKDQPSHPQTSGAQDLRLFRNGSLVKVWHDDLFNKASGCQLLQTKAKESRLARCRAEVPIVAEENDFTAYAFNTSNVKSADDTVKIEGRFPKSEGTLFILAIGVDKYANAAFNLPFSVSGVNEISDVIKQQQDKLTSDNEFKQYAKTKIITLENETATKENINLALNRFSTNNREKLLPSSLCANLSNNLCSKLKIELAKIEPTKPEDGLIIYFSGHGTSRDDRFYLLPRNYTGESDENSLINQAVSDIDLNQLLERIDAGRFLMVIDSCRSGQALGEEHEGRAPMNSKGLAQLAFDKGMLILTASQNQQSAYQVEEISGKEIKRSLLTYALFQGLTNQEANKNNDNELSAREWFDYAAEQVPLLYKKAIEATQIISVQESPNKQKRNKLVYLGSPDSNVQTPRVFYRREVEGNPMIMAKP